MKRLLTTAIVIGVFVVATVQTGGLGWLGNGRGNYNPSPTPVWVVVLCAVVLAYSTYKGKSRRS